MAVTFKPIFCGVLPFSAPRTLINRRHTAALGCRSLDVLHVASIGDQYYTLMDRGFMTSNDAKTGKEIYGRQRISVDSGTFSASPWSYNGKIFAISEDGDTFVMQAGPEFKVLGKNSLNEMTLASPAVVNDSLNVGVRMRRETCVPNAPILPKIPRSFRNLRLRSTGRPEKPTRS